MISDRRLPPLGNSFVTCSDYFDTRDPEESDVAIDAILEPTNRFRVRSHSLPGYIPQRFDDYIEGRLAQNLRPSSPNPAVISDAAAFQTEAWPDTDDEVEERSPNNLFFEHDSDDWSQTTRATSVFSSYSPLGRVLATEPFNASNQFQTWADMNFKGHNTSKDLMWPDTDEDSYACSEISAPLPSLLQKRVQPVHVDGHNFAVKRCGSNQAPAESVVLQLAEMTLPQKGAKKRDDQDNRVPIRTLLARSQPMEQKGGYSVSAVAIAKAKEIASRSGGVKCVLPKRSLAIHPQACVGCDTSDSKKAESLGTIDRVRKQQATTVMIRNLPGTLLQSELLAELDRSGFENDYDFCYMPGSFCKGGVAKGFAFVNFQKVPFTVRFVSAWHGTYRLGLCMGDSPVNISVASVQGLAANMARWQTHRVQRIKDPELRPFVRISRNHL